MGDFRLVARCQCDLDSSGILRSVNWYIVTVVSAQLLGPDLKGKTLQEELLLKGLILEERTDMLSRNIKYSKSKFSQNTTNLLSIINVATCFDS